jgi:hypothetical protein
MQRNVFVRGRPERTTIGPKARPKTRNFHYNVAHDLLRQNKTIIYPTTSSHQWVRGKGLHRSVKRRAQLLAFGQFGRRLVETSTMYKNRTILRGSEAYTRVCGSINDRLGVVLHLYVQTALVSQIETSILLEIYYPDSWSEWVMI